MQEIARSPHLVHESMATKEIPKEFIDMLIEDPTLIPSELKMEMMRDILRDDTNDAITRLYSEIEALEKVSPVQAHVTMIIVEAWLVARGYRMVEDRTVTRSITQELENRRHSAKQGCVTRAFKTLLNLDKETQTEIIRRNESLAADNYVLENQNKSLRSQAILTKEAAEKEAEASERRGENRKKELIQEGEQDKQRIIDEAKRESQAQNRLLQEKIALYSAECTRLEHNLGELRKLEERFRSNPDIDLAFELQSKLKVSELHTAFVEILSEIQEIVCSVASQDNVPEIGSYSNKICKIFLEKLLLSIDMAKQELKSEEYKATLSWLVEKFQWMIKLLGRGNTSAFGYMVRVIEIFKILLWKTENGMIPADLQKNLMEFSSDIKNIWESSDFKKRDSTLSNWEKRLAKQ